MVNKKFKDEYTLIAGVPAKVKKDKVKWKAGSYKINMLEYENNETKRMFNIKENL